MKAARRQTQGLSAQSQAAVATVATLKAQADADALRSGLKDTLRLEAGRTGEKVGRVPSDGPIRLKTRDGLYSLHGSGSLSDAEAQAGLAYRLCWEAAASGLKSSMGSDVRSTQAGSRVAFAVTRDPAALRRAYLMSRLNQMERAVGEDLQDGRELLALRMIAGEGRTLSSLATGGNAKVAYLASLRRALAAVSTVIQPKGLRIRDG